MTQLSSAVAMVEDAPNFTAFTFLATHSAYDARRHAIEDHGAYRAASDEENRLVDEYKTVVSTQIVVFRQFDQQLNTFLQFDAPVGELSDDLKNALTVLLDVVRLWLSLLQSPTRKLVAERLHLLPPETAREFESAMHSVEESCHEARDLLGFLLEDPTVDSSVFEAAIRVGPLKSSDTARG